MKKTTQMAKKSNVKRSWYLVDANNKILGRLAAKVAAIIRGKHKAIFTPHVDCGDNVIVVNASKIKVTGRKLKQKMYLNYSGYPGGLKRTSLEKMLKDKPTEVILRAVRRMLPRRPLYYTAIKKLRVYAGDKHPFNSIKTIKNLEV